MAEPEQLTSGALPDRATATKKLKEEPKQTQAIKKNKHKKADQKGIKICHITIQII